MKIKLHSLVKVTVQDNTESGRRVFIGEVVSTPKDGTIKVLAVPGRHDLAMEVPVDALSEPAAKYRYIQYAVVQGRGSFPTDMLRYDTCVPVNFKLVPSACGQKVVPNEDALEMIVADVTETKQPHWTPARWASFGWSLVHSTTEQIRHLYT